MADKAIAQIRRLSKLSPPQEGLGDVNTLLRMSKPLDDELESAEVFALKDEIRRVSEENQRLKRSSKLQQEAFRREMKRLSRQSMATMPRQSRQSQMERVSSSQIPFHQSLGIPPEDSQVEQKHHELQALAEKLERKVEAVKKHNEALCRRKQEMKLDADEQETRHSRQIQRLAEMISHLKRIMGDHMESVQRVSGLESSLGAGPAEPKSMTIMFGQSDPGGSSVDTCDHKAIKKKYRALKQQVANMNREKEELQRDRTSSQMYQSPPLTALSPRVSTTRQRTTTQMLSPSLRISGIPIDDVNGSRVSDLSYEPRKSLARERASTQRVQSPRLSMARERASTQMLQSSRVSLARERASTQLLQSPRVSLARERDSTPRFSSRNSNQNTFRKFGSFMKQSIRDGDVGRAASMALPGFSGLSAAQYIPRVSQLNRAKGQLAPITEEHSVSAGSRLHLQPLPSTRTSYVPKPYTQSLSHSPRPRPSYLQAQRMTF